MTRYIYTGCFRVASAALLVILMMNVFVVSAEEQARFIDGTGSGYGIFVMSVLVLSAEEQARFIDGTGSGYGIFEADVFTGAEADVFYFVSDGVVANLSRWEASFDVTHTRRSALRLPTSADRRHIFARASYDGTLTLDAGGFLVIEPCLTQGPAILCFAARTFAGLRK